MALRTRRDYFQVHTDIDAREFVRTSRWSPTCSE